MVQNFMKTNLSKTFILVFVAGIMIFLYGQIPYWQESYHDYDLVYFRAMANASPGLASVERPFAYRLLGPYLIGLVPFPDTVVFYVSEIVVSLALVLLFYFFLCDMGLSPSAALPAVVAFCFNKYLFGLTVWDYFQINILSSSVYVLILFWAIFKERWAVFGLVMLLGAATRETVMLMVPTTFFYLFEKRELRTKWKKAAIAMLPGIVVFFLLRALIPAAGGLGLVDAFLKYSTKLASGEALARLLLNSFIPFTFLPFVFWKTTRSFLEGKKYVLFWLAVVFVSSMFGGNNERLMAPTFLVFYWYVGVLLQDLHLDNLGMGIFVAAGFLSSFHHVIGRYPLPSRSWTEGLSLALLVVVTSLAIALRQKSRRQERKQELPTQ
jgi:hypothetical protein